MGYQNRRQLCDDAGYARFTLPQTPQDRLKAALRDYDRIYADGTTLHVLAPVPNPETANTLAARIATLIGTPVAPEFVPKENIALIDDLEINTATKEAWLHSTKPLTAQDISYHLNALAKKHPRALADIEAVYVRSDEEAPYFSARREADTITLRERSCQRGLEDIPVRGPLTYGFIVCPVKPGIQKRYYSVTKTLTIKTGEQ